MTKTACFVFLILAPASAALGSLPLRFEPNEGQAPPPVQFLARGQGYHLALSGAAARFDAGGAAVEFRLIGSEPGVQGRGEARLEGVSNYLRGADPARWRTGIAHYARVRFPAVYPGIDVVYYGAEGELEYDFLVRPGADPGRIEWEITGADRLSLDAHGDLILETPSGQVRQRRPRLYQDIAGVRREVAGRYRLSGRRVGFTVDSYEPGHTLIIDPVLQFSTFYGGRLRESATSITVDQSGNVYVAGSATSPDFPATSGVYQNRVLGNTDVFVVKMNSTGTQVAYSTLVGGSDDDTVAQLVVDQTGAAYVAGTTRSTNFPVTPGAYRETALGAADGFLFKLNNTGSALIYSTRLGGSAADNILAVAVDSYGSAYVAGDTASNDFPVTEDVLQTERKGANDAFVTKFNPSGSGLVYSTLLGGDTDSFIVGFEQVRAMVIDRANNVYVAGITTLRDFPVSRGAFQDMHLGQSDVFVTKIDPTATAIVWSTFLGGEGLDTVNAMAMDANNTNLVVVGGTTSARFPTTPQVIQNFNNFGSPQPSEGFVTRMNANGQVIYSTFLGGLGDDTLNGVATDVEGNAYVFGTTSSTDLPTTFDSIQRNNAQTGGAGEPYDAFLAYLNPFGQAITYATYLGGPRNEVGQAIARDAAGNLYLAGYTQSPGFPLTPGALQRTTGFGTSTAFIARIGETRPQPASIVIIRGNNQTADPATPLPIPLVVELRDAFNNPVGNATLTWSADNAALPAVAVTTGGNGRAEMTATLGTRPGTAIVTVRFGDLPPAQFTFTVRRLGPAPPAIQAGGVIGAGQSVPPVRTVSPLSLAIVKGDLFGPAGSLVTAEQAGLEDGKLPLVLNGACVTVDGIPARLVAAGDREILFQVPEIARFGPVPVVVIANCGVFPELRSEPEIVEALPTSPEFFFHVLSPDGRSPVQAVLDGAGEPIGPPGAVPGMAMRPARPNDVIRVFAQGLGPTSPATYSGEVVESESPLSEPPVLLLDNQQIPASAVLYAGAVVGAVGRYEIRFRVPADVRNGNLAIAIRTGLQVTPPGAYLAVAGGADRDPRISVSPAVLDFGDVVVGSSRELPFTIANVGTAPLTVEGFNTGLPVFTIAPNFGFILPPGEVRELLVRVTPTVLGPVSATLRIASTDPLQPILTVPMNATGITQPPAPNPIPAITTIQPVSVEAGGAPFNLIVNGSGFTRASVVEINGRPRATFFNFPGQLIAYVQAQDIAQPGALDVTVFSPAPGGGRSNPAVLSVRSSVPEGTPLAIINQLDLRACPVVTSFLSVLGASGYPMRNITNNNISCREEGDPVPCTIQPSAMETPLSITLIYGVNGIASAEQQILLKSAVRAFLTRLGAADRVALVHLEDVARPQVAFTEDKDRIINAIELLRPAGTGNALYDAVIYAAETTRREVGRRQMVVLFTALDNLSGNSRDLSQPLGSAQVSGVTYYTIAVDNARSNVNLTGFLRQLARDTYGQYFAESNALEYGNLFDKLSQILQGQYAVTHASPFFNGRVKMLEFTFQTPEGIFRATRPYTPCLPN